MTTSSSIIVLGSGNFGTCLAQHLATKGHNVILWGREQSVIESINLNHVNPKFLSNFTINSKVVAKTILTKQDFEKSQLVVLALPTMAIRSVLESHKSMLSPNNIIVSASKGIENETLKFPSQIITSVLHEKSSQNEIVILSGPSFASEIMQALPTCVSLASFSEQACLQVQNIFHAPQFRAYTTNDPIGLEVSGAIKNVIAIAAGACMGLGFQNNAQAALITRGLAEITRIGSRLGANPLTFTGLGCVGDLFLTCSSDKSRNFQVGMLLAKGLPIDQINTKIGSVAEGIYTAKAAMNLTSNLKVEAPITKEVFSVLYNKKPVKDAVQTLLLRDPKPELPANL